MTGPTSALRPHRPGTQLPAGQNTKCSESRNHCIIREMRILSTPDVLARFGKALADPTRAAILLELRSGHACPSELAERIGVTRQILSNHLACLRDCGLVAGDPAGRRVQYRLSDPRLAHALNDLLGTILTVNPICSCAEPDCPQDKPLPPTGQERMTEVGP